MQAFDVTIGLWRLLYGAIKGCGVSCFCPRGRNDKSALKT